MKNYNTYANTLTKNNNPPNKEALWKFVYFGKPSNQYLQGL